MPIRYRLLSVVAIAVLSLGCPPSEKAPEEGTEGVGDELAATPTYDCSAPHAFPADLSAQTQQGADGFAWQSFLAVSAGADGPAWKDWFSTVDLIECGQSTPPTDGTCEGAAGQQKYYPSKCVAEFPDTYKNYSVIDQVGKVDDGFEEAKTQGLSANPVIASNGTFLRYQIVISPGTFEWIKLVKLQTADPLSAEKPVQFPCSGKLDEYSQAMSLKLAWMDTKAPPQGQIELPYYTQPMLVFTPSYRNSARKESCELKVMGLVGMHLVRKTVSQPAWVWATFEHNQNAPLCTAEPNSGYKDETNPSAQGSTNTSCPANVSQGYNFHLQDCSGDKCAACNTGYPATLPYGNALAQNGTPYDLSMGGNPPAGVCVNPENIPGYKTSYQKWVDGGKQGAEPAPPPSWCLDKAPASQYGHSTLCRQVQPAGYGYTGATFADTEPNQACRPGTGPWANYDLISTQWSTSFGTCTGTPPLANVQAQVYDDSAGNLKVPQDIAPQTPVTGQNVGGTGTSHRSYMANSSMESYERSNCMGCHSKSTFGEGSEPVSTAGTDFVYFLGLEVPAAP